MVEDSRAATIVLLTATSSWQWRRLALSTVSEPQRRAEGPRARIAALRRKCRRGRACRGAKGRGEQKQRSTAMPQGRGSAERACNRLHAARDRAQGNPKGDLKLGALHALASSAASFLVSQSSRLPAVSGPPHQGQHTDIIFSSLFSTSRDPRFAWIRKNSHCDLRRFPRRCIPWIPCYPQGKWYHCPCRRIRACAAIKQNQGHSCQALSFFSSLRLRPPGCRQREGKG